jgi:hypothetical protein
MVTQGAIDLGVLACRLLPCAVNLLVTCAAGCRRSIIRIGYLQRSVNRMTLGAGCDFLPCKMRLVAIKTGRFQPVCCVADIASDLGVFARELGQLLLRAWMALAAGIRQCAAHSHFPGGMWVCVTTQAIGHLCAVRLVVAGVALRHYGIVIPPSRVVDMECAVAFLTVEAVFSAVFLYVFKHTRVALSALVHCQRLWRSTVKLRVWRYLHLHFPVPLCGKGHCGHNAQDQNNCCNNMTINCFHRTFLLLKKLAPRSKTSNTLIQLDKNQLFLNRTKIA